MYHRRGVRPGSNPLFLAALSGALGGGAAPPLLDTYPAAAAYSTRQLSSTATNCLMLRRGSDDAEQDFGFVNGWLDTAAITTWLGGASGYIKTWYDQTGGSWGNATQADPAKQPLYVASGINSRPTLEFDTTDDVLIITEKTLTGEFTTFCVFNAQESYSILFGKLSTDYVRVQPGIEYLFRANASNTSLSTTGVVNQTIDALACVVRDASDNLIIEQNGIDITDGTPNNANDFDVTSLGNTSVFFNALQTEQIYYDGHLSAEDRAAITANIMVYWGL